MAGFGFRKCRTLELRLAPSDEVNSFIRVVLSASEMAEERLARALCRAAVQALQQDKVVHSDVQCSSTICFEIFNSCSYESCGDKFNNALRLLNYFLVTCFADKGTFSANMLYENRFYFRTQPSETFLFVYYCFSVKKVLHSFNKLDFRCR